MSAKARRGDHPRNRRRLFMLGLMTLALSLAAAGGAIAYVSASNASKANRFKDAAKRHWRDIERQSEALALSLEKVESPESLNAVASGAAAMSRFLDEVDGRIGGRPAPPGYGDLSASQKAAVANLGAYVNKVFEIARVKEEQELARQRGLLESRSRKAMQSVNDFLSDAAFLDVNIPGAFYQAGGAMANAFRPPDYANDAERQAVYDTMNAFMKADVEDGDFDRMWSLLSARLINGLNYNNITRERVRDNWGNMWGEARATGYYVSWRDINIPEPATATSVVIAYMDEGGPRTRTVRLVKEQGAWKIDSYPFIGLIG